MKIHGNIAPGWYKLYIHHLSTYPFLIDLDSNYRCRIFLYSNLKSEQFIHYMRGKEARLLHAHNCEFLEQNFLWALQIKPVFIYIKLFQVAWKKTPKPNLYFFVLSFNTTNMNPNEGSQFYFIETREAWGWGFFGVF